MELGGTGVEKILEAIKNQRWYFIKNKPKVLFDKSTGLLWANLNTFNYLKEGRNGYFSSEVDNIISGYSFGMDGFRVPTCYELWQAVEDKTIPFHRKGDGYWLLLGNYYYICEYNGDRKIKYLEAQGATSKLYDNRGNSGALFPCSDYLIQDTDYQEKVKPGNPVYTEKERLQFTLDLFTKNELWPIFDDAEVTELYKQIYFEKPKLLAQLQELQTQINDLQKVTLLSSDFDYTALLAKYDIKAIDASLIKYYQAVQQWCRELMEKVDYYEEQKASVIKDFNLISLKLSKKYEADTNLTEAENDDV